MALSVHDPAAARTLPDEPNVAAITGGTSARSASTRNDQTKPGIRRAHTTAV